MAYIASGCLLILLVMFDVIKTTLTTKGEGWLSAIVSGGFRNLASLSLRAGSRVSEIMGALAVLAIGSTWLVGLWAGWVLVFLGLPNAIEYSTPATVDLYDYLYFVGFTLSTLGIGDITPNGNLAQLATTLASFNGLLIITLIVTYAIALVSGVVARRVLAYKIYLAGGEDGDFQTKFETVDDFAAWLKAIKSDLIFCTEQRLAYPVLDNFLSKEKSHSLAVQLTNLCLASRASNQGSGVSRQSRREFEELFSVLRRYTLLTGITDDDLLVRLRKLSSREGWSDVV